MKQQKGTSTKGAVFQVSDTKWIAKICLGVDDNGKPIIKQFSGKTEAIAKKKLRDFKKSTDYVEKHIPSTDMCEKRVEQNILLPILDELDRECNTESMYDYYFTRLDICFDYIIPSSIKPLALVKVTYENGYYLHTNLGSFSTDDGAEKQFTLAQGLEWTGGDSIDDYC